MGRKRIHPKFFTCEICSKQIENIHGFPLLRFCSVSCTVKSPDRKYQHLEKYQGWNRGMKFSGMSGKKQSELFFKKLRERNTSPSNPFNRPDVKEKVRLWHLGRTGPLAPNWKGGIVKYTFARKMRNSVEYKKWRDSIFERDGYRCTLCKSTERLEADHIHPISVFPCEALVLENGRTLCRPCHKKTPTYGGRVLSYAA